MKGCYLLLIDLKHDKEIQIGKLGKILFKKGYYVYVGSGLNNLEKRIKRHIKKEKKMHWHIDYFLRYGKIIEVFYKENIVSEECFIADKFNNFFNHIHGFGCSDCKCKSHLFYGSIKEIKQTINKLKMKSLYI